MCLEEEVEPRCDSRGVAALGKCGAGRSYATRVIFCGLEAKQHHEIAPSQCFCSAGQTHLCFPSRI